MKRLFPIAAAAVGLTASLLGGGVAGGVVPGSAARPSTLVDLAETDAVSTSVTTTATRGTYVALGDSFTSGLGVRPVDLTAPSFCGRSAANYPHRVAGALGMRLADRSCSGADIADLTRGQFPGLGPQFDALSRRTRLVTVGIGVNNSDLFARAFDGCTEAAALVRVGALAPCSVRIGSTVGRDLRATADSMRSALRQIKKKAPRATIVVVGYPKIFPTGAAGRQRCAAAGMPLTQGDLAFLDDLERDLNAVLRAQARAAGVRYVDAYKRSVGHDMCAKPADRWIEPLVPLGLGSRVHPNAAGQRDVARAVLATVRGS